MNTKIRAVPFYEANILSELKSNQAINFSFNFFGEEGIIEFFFDEVFSEIESSKENVEELKTRKEGNDLIDEKAGDMEQETIEEDIHVKNKKTTTSLTGYAVAVVVIVACFIGFNFLKLQNQINSNFLVLGKNLRLNDLELTI